jgi:glycosyltransferase involved in cell wall biosynthesis
LENLVVPEVSFVIPARNEEQSIGAIVAKLVTTYPESEIIVVNDGSNDATASVASNAGATVINHVMSLGNGAAIKCGIRHAKSDTVVLMDADGQHAVECVAKLLSAYRDGFDLVVGARRGLSNHSSLWRWMANLIYNKLSSLVTGSKILDLTSGFRVVNREKFMSILHLLPNGFSYPTTSTIAFMRSGFQVAFETVDVNPGLSGSHIRPFHDGFRFFLIIFKVVMLYSPFKVLFPLSISQFIIGLLLYLPGVLAGVPSFTNGMALLFSGGVLTLSVAILSEQITILLYK